MITKELCFDLEFLADETIRPLTVSGAEYLDTMTRVRPSPTSPFQCLFTRQEMYSQALDFGLHVRFENAEMRDRTTGAGR